MENEQRSFECTAVEAEVLSAIKCWPGVPAIVTFWPERGWSVSTAQDDVQRHYQEMGPFDRSLLDAEYRRLNYAKGWTFMMCPEACMMTANVAIVGLNPGGGGDLDSFHYGGNWDVPQGNAYFRPWDEGRAPSPLQQQVQQWHKVIGVGPNETFCAQFVPFRSPDWKRLDNYGEALEFSRRLWRWTLARSPAATFLAMGKVVGIELCRLLDCEPVATFESGWGAVKIELAKGPGGRRVVTMPHPSRYLLFGRGAASNAAEASLRKSLVQ